MILLFLAAILFFTFQNISFKQFSSVYMKNNASYFIFNAIYFSLICAIYAVIGISITNFVLPIIALSLLFAVSFISAIYLYMKALENGPLGLSFLFFSAGILMPILFGIIVYSEPAPLHNFAGLALLFVAFFISTMGKGGNKLTKKWAIYILFSSLANGIIGITVRLSSTVVPENASRDFLFLGFGQAAIISLIIGFLLICKHKIQITHFRGPSFAIVVLATAITTAGGNYIMVVLSQTVPALVQFPVINGSLVITSIIASRLVYKEQVTKQHLLVVLFGLVAIVMLSI